MESNSSTESCSLLIKLINAEVEKLRDVSNDEIRRRSLALKINSGSDPRGSTIYSFAYLKEIVRRYLGVTLYDTQLLGGLLLTKGTIIEMKTGEGKSLVATLPSYFKALEKKGVHIITVNEYLAERDWRKMRELYNMLGIKVGLIKDEMELEEKQFNYNCDITYLTNTSLGFDYLRDNLATRISQIVQRPFHFAVVDEVDSVLIDEALTPLIISGSGDVINDEKYTQAAFLVQYLTINEHFIVNQKRKTASLTEIGIQTCETLLAVSNLYDVTNPWIPYILNAIRAKVFYIKNKNYIVQNNKVLIIDEFTGRILYGRQWSQGLQQAIQAKESLRISPITQTYASITYQNLFLLYPQLSGMTGTAKTAELELEKIYQLQVNVLPTARKLQRVDLKDLVFLDEFTKWLAIVRVCQSNYRVGRPVLVGTTTVENSQLLSTLLKKSNVNHKLLNAKAINAKFEAEIISQAGLPQSVTIATNMAGRGADIILGGSNKTLAQNKIKSLFYSKSTDPRFKKYQKKVRNKFINKAYKFNSLLFLFVDFTNDLNYLQVLDPVFSSLLKKFEVNLIQYYLQKYDAITKLSARLVKLRGGLFVIGTERHDSIRIDNQLRGRAGRQGDKGLSRFVLSLDDKLLKIFGGTTLQNIMQMGFGAEDDKYNIIQLESTALTKNINKIQRKVEDFSYDSRNQLFKYDEIINSQREAIFSERKKFLYGINVKDRLLEYSYDIFNDLARDLFLNPKSSVLLKLEGTVLSKLFYANPLKVEWLLRNKTLNFDLFQESFNSFLWQGYEVKEAEIEIFLPGTIRRLEKTIILNNIDVSWKTHLQKMDSLKECVGWRGYGQKDPIIEYKNESYDLFLWTINEIRQGVTDQIYNFELK
jgi:preprotein translocase subunit SecA